MGKKYLIEYDREGCIGVAACTAVDPENWILVEDGKADLKDSKKEPKKGYYTREIDESELTKWKAAAESCPVLVIHIKDLETGEKII